MMNKILQECSEIEYFKNQTALNATTVSPEDRAISAAVTVTFLVGIIQVEKPFFNFENLFLLNQANIQFSFLSSQYTLISWDVERLIIYFFLLFE